MVRTALLLTSVLAAGFVSQAPPLELDHISIVVPPGAPLDLVAFQSAGFRLLTPTPTVDERHGTASRSVAFENMYIELIWVTDRAKLTVADPELGARLRHDDARIARLGFALRRLEAGGTIPFPTREYGTDSLALRVAKTATHEPFVSVVPPEFSWLLRAAKLSPELPHPNGARRVTRVTWVTRKRGGQAPVMGHLGDAGVRFGFAATSFVELELDDGQVGKLIDLRPQLPLVFRQ